jgi:hypothetical protein
LDNFVGKYCKNKTILEIRTKIGPFEFQNSDKKIKMVEIKVAEGHYFGQMKNKKCNGIGVLIEYDGYLFEGNYKDGHLDGEGR